MGIYYVVMVYVDVVMGIHYVVMVYVDVVMGIHYVVMVYVDVVYGYTLTNCFAPSSCFSYNNGWSIVI